MQHRRLDPFGNPNVGVYVRATEKHLWLPPGLTDNNVEDLAAALGLEPIEITIGGSPLIGSLVAANSNGAVVADFATDREIAILENAGLSVVRLRHSRLNAAGNNILCNDKGALLHPDLSDGSLGKISDALGVPCVRGELAEIPTVGTAAVATNKGAMCHPLSTEAQLAHVKQALQVPARIGTVNHGHGLVGAGIAANLNGVVVGARTTGIELGRIEEALGFLE